jgi:uncharacterized protein (TIGR00290 family)
MNWSGGKDSGLALYKVLKEKKYHVNCLLTSVSEGFNRVSMHGVRTALLEKQAEMLKLPLVKISLPEEASILVYNNKMESTLIKLKDRGICVSIFGDIFLEDLRQYREEQSAKLKIRSIFPLWKRSTSGLMREFISLGFKAVVVCVNDAFLDKSFLGRELDEAFLNDLPAGVDPCGENGEYHSFVYDGPIFKEKIGFSKREIVYRQYKSPPDSASNGNGENPAAGFWFLDLISQTN